MSSEQDFYTSEELNRKVVLVYNNEGAFTSDDTYSAAKFDQLRFIDAMDRLNKHPNYEFNYWIKPGDDYVYVTWLTYYRTRQPFAKGSVFDLFDTLTGNTGYEPLGEPNTIRYPWLP